MDIQIDHGPAYSLAVCKLAQGDSIRAESGAMVSQTANLRMETSSKMGKKGGIQMNIDQSTKIDAPVTNSNVASHSPDATQTTNINAGLESLLSKILQKAETDDEITKKEYAKVVKGIRELKAELSKPKPQRSVVERILGNLGSIASLASLANQVAPFLPTLL